MVLSRPPELPPMLLLNPTRTSFFCGTNPSRKNTQPLKKRLSVSAAKLTRRSKTVGYYGWMKSLRRPNSSGPNELSTSLLDDLKQSEAAEPAWRLFVASGGRCVASFKIKQRRNIGGWNGLTEKVSLSLCAAICFQIGQLPGVFDALGSGRKAKSLCNAEDRANDHLALVALTKAGHAPHTNL